MYRYEVLLLIGFDRECAGILQHKARHLRNKESEAADNLPLVMGFDRPMVVSVTEFDDDLARPLVNERQDRCFASR